MSDKGEPSASHHVLGRGMMPRIGYERRTEAFIDERGVSITNSPGGAAQLTWDEYRKLTELVAVFWTAGKIEEP